MSCLKEIVRHLVARVGGPIAASKLLGVSTTEISYWSNPNSPRFIPVDHLVDLDAAGGDLFLKHLARKRGYADLVKLDAESEPAGNVIKAVGHFSKAGGALNCAALEAASDRRITPTERRALYEHIRPVKDSIDELERSIAS